MGDQIRLDLVALPEERTVPVTMSRSVSATALIPRSDARATRSWGCEHRSGPKTHC
ncbi:hypothetical protein [Streptomyces rubiginosohelvolus]